MNKIAEALTEEMKFKAGDVVCLTATVVRWVAEFQLNGTKVDRSKYASRVLNLPPSYSVVARCVDQCPAGVVQKYYAIRGEPTHGKLPGNYHEHELCLLSDAVAQIEAVVLPPMEETMIDLAALERLLAEATKTACDRATPCTSLCWRSVPACVPSAAVQRVLAERDALRAEVERMRAVVEAAREIDSACDRDEPRYVPCRDSSGSGALCRACRVDVALAAALAALDGKDSAK